MTEQEVNEKVREWLLANGFRYKGVLRDGDVPAPDGYRRVRIDHQGYDDANLKLIWVEAKGSNTPLSELLEGFIRLAYAMWHGGGDGLLAVPSQEAEMLLDETVRPFLAEIAATLSLRGNIGIWDVEGGKMVWL
jgi:hypothetical protein